MLLIPGYWHSTYWVESYWNIDYWPHYAMPEKSISFESGFVDELTFESGFVDELTFTSKLDP